MRDRVGRHKPQLVYAQIGDEPPAPAGEAMHSLRGQLAAWRSTDQEGYDPGDLAEAAEALLDLLDRLDAAVPGEPAVAPPPVGALLDLVDELHSAVRDDDSTGIDRARGNIVMAVRDLYAAGVADGRRQATDG